MKKTVGIFIFDNAEVLDFAGPFEVFSVTSELNNFELFNVFTVAKTKEAISAVNGLSVNPKYDFNDCPKVDILILAGGDGTNQAIQDQEIIDWIAKTDQETEITMSICSGSRFLAKIGALDDNQYCTHHLVYGDMEKLVPSGKPVTDKRYVQSNSKTYTSGGISAGIDLSFYIVEKILGKKTVEKTAKYMEYIINEA
ncbi:DJ-1/PfpI family protein [uncultured Tenacibaculum sp.]|uniref:DJ-1/PfpI family protein n=1 Tax=uncultured Tenacibaculum sp. TaxID=174713 RepID=UPI002639E8FE|nr:DJ-1/PfpI family protein [uncultured Tenacibaculum sp.]